MNKAKDIALFVAIGGMVGAVVLAVLVTLFASAESMRQGSLSHLLQAVKEVKVIPWVLLGCSLVVLFIGTKISKHLGPLLAIITLATGGMALLGLLPDPPPKPEEPITISIPPQAWGLLAILGLVLLVRAARTFQMELLKGLFWLLALTLVAGGGWVGYKATGPIGLCTGAAIAGALGAYGLGALATRPEQGGEIEEGGEGE